MNVDGKAAEVSAPEALRLIAGEAAQPLTPGKNDPKDFRTLEERLQERFGFSASDSDLPAYLKPPPKISSKPRPGRIVRELSVMDRNLIVGCCRDFCKRKGQKGVKYHDRLNDVMKLLAFKETIEFYAYVRAVNVQLNREWRGAWTKYDRWLDYKAGLPVKVDTALEGEEGARTIIEPFDPTAPAPAKPSLIEPKLPDDEFRGPIRTYQIPVRLDEWISECIATAEPHTDMTENYMALCRLYEIEADPKKKGDSESDSDTEEVETEQPEE